MNLGTERLAATNDLAAQAGSALTEILGVVRKAADEAELIARKAEEVEDQAAAAVQTFNNVAAMTEENTAASEEMAQGVSDLVRAANRIAVLAEEKRGRGGRGVGVGGGTDGVGRAGGLVGAGVEADGHRTAGSGGPVPAVGGGAGAGRGSTDILVIRKQTRAPGGWSAGCLRVYAQHGRHL